MVHLQRKPSSARMLRRLWIPFLLLFLAGCHVDMYDQPRYTANQPSDFFADGRSMRQPVAGSVPAGSFSVESPLRTGRVNGELATELPPELTLNADLLNRGQFVYDVYCAPCHGIAGDGQGVIAYRGPLTVPTLHQDRLRSAEPGYLFGVITNGIGKMYGYGSRIQPEDRWAAIAYVRALQLSQNADVSLLTAEEQSLVEAGR
jgi:mono/diheme cytochrome c family protein